MPVHSPKYPLHIQANNLKLNFSIPTPDIILHVSRHFDWHTQNSQHFRHAKTQRHMTQKKLSLTLIMNHYT